MDIDKIVKQYKLMVILRPILKFWEILVLWIILPFIITIYFSEILKSKMPIILLMIYSAYLYISLITLMNGNSEFFEKYTPTAFLTKRFFLNYKKKWGMTESQIKEYIKSCKKKEEAELKRIQYLKEEKRILANASKQFVSPIIQRLCIMNLDARNAQEIFLQNIYPADRIKDVFETNFSDSQFNEAIQYWKKRGISDKKMLVNYLYKLTILEDGIHNDEWKFMINLMSRLRFSMNFINFFTNRYYALRTEFEDSKFKREDGSSTAEKSDTKLASYYSILGVSSNASYEEVKKAYHSLALMHHPDLPQNAGRIHECEELMAKFNEAYNKIIKN